MMGPPGPLGRKRDNKQGERDCAAEALLQERSNARRAHGCLMRDTFKSPESTCSRPAISYNFVLCGHEIQEVASKKSFF